MLPKKYRLPLPIHMEEAKKTATPYFLLKYKLTNNQDSRFAFIITKRIEVLATRRNKLKRMFRDAVHKNLTLIPEGHDFLFVISKKAQGISQEQLESAIMAALEKI